MPEEAERHGEGPPHVPSHQRVERLCLATLHGKQQRALLQRVVVGRCVHRNRALRRAQRHRRDARARQCCRSLRA
jgi:hypothetical protein